MAVEPVSGTAAALVALPDEQALVLADYHAGLEASLRAAGVEIPGRVDERREQVLDLLADTGADRLVVLGDVGDSIGVPKGDERAELVALLDAVTERVPVTVVRGNHDGAIEQVTDDYDAVEATPGHGVRMGPVGFAHGHTWPAPDVLRADVLCTAHEHPMVRLSDEVGGARGERVWLRGGLDPAPFEAHHDVDLTAGGELVVLPAFNALTGGTWVNVEGQEFLAPYLPEGLADGQAYLLDGTRLGDYRRV